MDVAMFVSIPALGTNTFTGMCAAPGSIKGDDFDFEGLFTPGNCGWVIDDNQWGNADHEVSGVATRKLDFGVPDWEALKGGDTLTLLGLCQMSKGETEWSSGEEPLLNEITLVDPAAAIALSGLVSG